MNISVIVPSYNSEKYLRKCIDSILAQTLKDFELIIVNDGSTDNSGSICDSYEETDKRVHVIHQSNKGPSEARNAGINWTVSNTNCRWITFIDSDDYVSDDFLQTLWELTDTYKTKCSVVGYSCIHDYGEEDFCGDQRTLKLTPDDAFGYYPIGVTPDYSLTCAWGKLFAIELFKGIRFPAGRIMEDRFTTHKLLFQCEFIAISTEHLYMYYQSPGSIIRTGWYPKKTDAFDAFDEQLLFFKENSCHQAYRKTAHEYLVVLKEPLIPGVMPEYCKEECYKPIKKKFREKLIEYKNVLDMSWLDCLRQYSIVFSEFARYICSTMLQIYRKVRRPG